MGLENRVENLDPNEPLKEKKKGPKENDPETIDTTIPDRIDLFLTYTDIVDQINDEELKNKISIIKENLLLLKPKIEEKILNKNLGKDKGDTLLQHNMLNSMSILGGFIVRIGRLIKENKPIENRDIIFINSQADMLISYLEKINTDTNSLNKETYNRESLEIKRRERKERRQKSKYRLEWEKNQDLQK